MTADAVVGIAGDVDLGELARRLEELLEVRFEERESGYYNGGTYYLAEPGGKEQLRLYGNHDPLDGRPFFEDASTALLRLLFTERDPHEIAGRIADGVGRDAHVLQRVD